MVYWFSFRIDLLMLTGGGRGGPTLLMLAYRGGGEGGKNGEKDAYVICECSLTGTSYL